MKLHHKTLALLIIIAGYGSASAVWVSSYAQDTNDRIHSDGSFIGALPDPDYDFSGVGRTSTGWATMISDQHFLSAAHAVPSGTITFYDSSGGAIATRTVAAATAISNEKRPISISGTGEITVTPFPIPDTAPLATIAPTTDLWVGRVNSPVVDVAHYQIGKAILGQEVLVVGNCPDGVASCEVSPTQFVVGRNEIHSLAEVSTVSGTTRYNSIGFAYEHSAASPGDTRFESLDSGAPTFIVSGGSLQVVGVHSGVDGFADGAMSFDVALQAYTAEIAAVPEPAAWLLLSTIATLSFGAGWARRRAVQLSC